MPLTTKKTSTAAMRTRRRTAGRVPEPFEALYFSRDDSWMKFNERVLEEADDASNPLLERVKFLAITASNLDEFIEIRVAGILQRIEDGYHTPQPVDEGGLTPQERLELLKGHLARFVEAQYLCWNQRLQPALLAEKIRVLSWRKLSDAARERALEFYAAEVDPLLTPITIDPSQPFPHVLNKALCLALLLKRKHRTNHNSNGRLAPAALGVVTVPRALPRLIALPSDDGWSDFIMLHELIESQAEKMFRGYEVLTCAPFRVTRNSNLYMQEEESRSVLETVRSELYDRRRGDAVRLEIEASATEEITERLRTNFELEPWQVFRVDGPVNLSRLMNLYGEAKRTELKFPAFRGRQFRLSPKSADIFEELRKRDVLLHHPFDSYSTVEGLIEAGARDPSVISMKQTLYRTSKDSPIFRALIEAGESKDVTVVVELMARFDEDSNIRWARELEEAGVGVFHGIFGFKTHCKLALLTRRDSDGVTRQYAHLGTGNYNPVTARLYTDISLLTSRPEVTAAVQKVFHYLTAETEAETYKPLFVAPLTLEREMVALIDREAAHAKAGKPARIIAKMNGLMDQKVIEALYAASRAGAEIDLIVRGICSLRPGVKGLSERIRVRSIVGRFLEHSRIFSFANGGNEEIFSGSADWMTRNLVERCETVFPITAPELKQRLREEILAAYLADNTKARVLQPNGEYLRPPQTGEPFSAQEYLMRVANGSDEKVPPTVCCA